MKLNGIIGSVGNTPLIKLNRISDEYNFNIYAKLEYCNPSGSLKDRAAISIIKTALENGWINSQSTIIECSSGNFGLALALICKYLSLKFVCIIDARVTHSHIKLLKKYDAEIVVVTEPDAATGEFLPMLIKTAQKLAEEIPNSYWTNQHGNLANAAGYNILMSEIMNTLENKVDYLFIATSSCGTLRGCHDYIKRSNLPVKIFAVDAEGSKIFSKSDHKRIIPGHGAGLVPPLYSNQINCEPIIISAEQSVFGCRKLFETEAILAGGSSGAIISAIPCVKEKIRENANCVVILCDRGDRYLDTLFSSEWTLKYLNLH